MKQAYMHISCFATGCLGHDERVLAIISPPGILLSGTGHLHPERGSEQLEDLIVRCQPYLQRSNFVTKLLIPSVQEQFGNSEIHVKIFSICTSIIIFVAS